MKTNQTEIARSRFEKRAEEANAALSTGVGLQKLGTRVLSTREDRYKRLFELRPS